MQAMLVIIIENTILTLMHIMKLLGLNCHECFADVNYDVSVDMVDIAIWIKHSMKKKYLKKEG